MINSASDFHYITPPAGVVVDGSYIAEALSTDYYPIYWQDIGFLIEACKERDELCQCRDSGPYPFWVTKSIRAVNPRSASQWIAHRFNNEGDYPEYAYLGTYVENGNPKFGTPVFISADTSVEDILPDKFTDVTTWTTRTPDASPVQVWLAGNDIYQHMISSLSGSLVEREPELSDVHAIEAEPLAKMQRNISKLKKVLYGFYGSTAWGTNLTAMNLSTRPTIFSIGKSQLYKVESNSGGVPTPSGSAYVNGLYNGASTNWSGYNSSSGGAYIGNTYTQYTDLIDGWGNMALVFNRLIQGKVVSAKMYCLHSMCLDIDGTYANRQWKWILTKFNLRKNGIVTLGDGVHDKWEMVNGYTTTKDWLRDMIVSQGGTMRAALPVQNHAMYSDSITFVEALFEPNAQLADGE